jgi:PPOX class probable F420-dependent enzyme
MIVGRGRSLETKRSKTIMAIDFTTDLGKRASDLLDTSGVIWLVTVGAAGRPTPSLVWFLREDEATLLIFSEPHVTKVKHIRENPKVALHFNSDDHGNSMVVLNGNAEVLGQPSSEVLPEAYVTKYAEGLKSLGMSGDKMVTQYSAAIRVHLTTLRGH